MAENGITFHNESEIKVHAQIFAGRTLVGTCLLDPGETHRLPAEPLRYDIFLKNGTTGWEVARTLDSAATTVILRRVKGQHVIIDSRD